MTLLNRTLMDYEDALNWLNGYLLRKPETKAALLARTAQEARSLFAERLADPVYNQYLVSMRRIKYHNGSSIVIYTADAPEELRGPQFDIALVQERCDSGAVANLEYAVRLGDDPQVVYARV